MTQIAWEQARKSKFQSSGEIVPDWVWVRPQGRPAIADSRSAPLTLIRHGVGVTIIALIRR